MLDIKQLSINFSSKQAVKGISFEIKEGETLGIVGESGSGKSISALSILGLLPQTAQVHSESMLFEKKSLNNLDEKQLQNLRGNQIAIIFQEQNALNPVLTCGYQVAEVLIEHKKIDKSEAKKQVLTLFEQVKLSNPERIFDAYPHQLSGGQQQRIMIAMAIACRPKLLIADEPTTALDVSVQQEILSLLNELKHRYHLSILFISHDLGVISKIADRVLVMCEGEIVEEGSIQQIFEQPQHPYTKGLIACRPTLDKQTKRLPTIEDFIAHKNTDIALKTKKSIPIQTPLLAVKNLSTWFPTKTNFFGKVSAYIKAVDNISFNLYPNETLGVVGESGSGKSTLARSILKLVPTQSGSIFYKGQDLLQVSAEEMRLLRKEIQIIFQNPYAALNPKKTIGEALIEPFYVHQIGKNAQERKEKAIESIERVKLSADFFERMPNTLSGGQLQRVVIAKALATSPQLLICDECVASLDVSIQAQILNLLVDLQEQLGLSYLFISHDLAVVKWMSDNIMVMKNGQIEEMAPAENLYQHPQKDYTKQLIKDSFL